MGRLKRGWYERQETEKITLDWVKTNCRVTPRELELLRLVYDRKLVRRDHLEIISPSYRNAGDGRTKILNNSITKLFRQMCLDKIHEKGELGKGNYPCTVALDRAGSILLGLPHKRRIIHNVNKYNGEIYITRSLPSNYRHINGINLLETQTIMICDDIGYSIEKWNLEVPREFHYANEEILLKPDITLEISNGNKSFLGFIEFDTGSENLRYKTNFPIIHDKIVKYKKYKMSTLWEDEFDYFPLLLLVTEDDKRIPYFNEKCKEIGIRGIGVYYENYTKFMYRLLEKI
jgi:hypothetical protein